LPGSNPIANLSEASAMNEKYFMAMTPEGLALKKNNNLN
jgi:hypothetical protein